VAVCNCALHLLISIRAVQARCEFNVEKYMMAVLSMLYHLLATDAALEATSSLEDQPTLL